MADDKKPETPAEKIHTVEDLKRMAHDYAVPMSEGTMAEIAKDLTPEKAKAFEEYIKIAAQGLYPTLAPQIKAGIPTAYLLDPYRQVAKQVLGDDHEPNFQSDPASMAALSGNVDPATGRPAPMSLDQWRGHLQSHPSFNYDSTPQAQQTAQNALSGFMAAMNEEPGVQ